MSDRLYIDGPRFAAWVEYRIRNDEHVDRKLRDRVRHWRRGEDPSVWSADEFLTRYHLGHLDTDIPKSFFKDHPKPAKEYVPRLPKRKVDAIAKAYANLDITVEEIGERHGVSREVITKIRKWHGLPSRYELKKQRAHLHNAEVARKERELLDKTISLDEACELTGLSQFTLRKRRARGHIRSVMHRGKVRYYSEEMQSLAEDKDLRDTTVGSREARAICGWSRKNLIMRAERGEIRVIWLRKNRRYFPEDLKRIAK